MSERSYHGATSRSKGKRDFEFRTIVVGLWISRTGIFNNNNDDNDDDDDDNGHVISATDVHDEENVDGDDD